MAIIQGDNGYRVPFVVIKDRPEDLTGAFVEVVVERGGQPFNKQAVIDDAKSGRCHFILSSSDLRFIGTYTYQWTAYFPDGRIYSGKQQSLTVHGKMGTFDPNTGEETLVLPFATKKDLEDIVVEGVTYDDTEIKQELATTVKSINGVTPDVNGNVVVEGTGGGTGADGKSAYEIWLGQGNVGTEQDFLKSLKGDKGEPGAGGETGGKRLVFETLEELQAFYPNGAAHEVLVLSENARYEWDGAVVDPPVDTTPPVLTITPNTGTYNSNQTVTMTVNETADIFYTLDGSTPTTTSTKYTVPITVSATTTIKAFAKDTAGNQSTVQTKVFTIDKVAPTVTVSPTAGTYSSAQSVTLSADETATIYYTLDGSTPTESSSVYSTALSIPNTATLKYFAKDTAGNKSAIQTAVYTINVPDTTPPTVTASPIGGTFTSAQSVTLSANETATIYYTVDGSDPTTSSTVYSGPISVTENKTLKYFGKDTAGNSSSVQTQAYTINIPPADTTPPVLTITPAGTFTDTKTVTMTTDETATIWYTLDDTDPKTSGTKIQYTAPLTLTETDTVKAYAKDTAGNESAVQTVTYTKETTSNVIPGHYSFLSGSYKTEALSGSASGWKGSHFTPIESITISDIKIYLSSPSSVEFEIWEADITAKTLKSKVAVGFTGATVDGDGYVTGTLSTPIVASTNKIYVLIYNHVSGSYKYYSSSITEKFTSDNAYFQTSTFDNFSKTTRPANGEALGKTGVYDFKLGIS